MRDDPVGLGGGRKIDVAGYVVLVTGDCCCCCGGAGGGDGDGGGFDGISSGGKAKNEI